MTLVQSLEHTLSSEQVPLAPRPRYMIPSSGLCITSPIYIIKIIKIIYIYIHICKWLGIGEEVGICICSNFNSKYSKQRPMIIYFKKILCHTFFLIVLSLFMFTYSRNPFGIFPGRVLGLTPALSDLSYNIRHTLS